MIQYWQSTSTLIVYLKPNNLEPIFVTAIGSYTGTNSGTDIRLMNASTTLLNLTVDPASSADDLPYALQAVFTPTTTATTSFSAEINVAAGTLSDTSIIAQQNITSSSSSGGGIPALSFNNSNMFKEVSNTVCTTGSTSSVCVPTYATSTDPFATGVVFMFGILLFVAGIVTWKILTDKIA